MSKLEKARIVIYDKTFTPQLTMPVQFNPAEYNISRHMTASSKRRVGGDQRIKDRQPVAGNLATLSVTLYFDSISDLDHITLGGLASGAGKLLSGKMSIGKLGSHLKNFYTSSEHNDVRAVCNEIAERLRYDPELKCPPKVGFLWGSTEFAGMLSSVSIDYTMFSSDGVPVRAKMSISLHGEEMKYITAAMGSGTMGTGQITASGADQLWQVAVRTTGQAGNWKKLASDNGVANARKQSGSKMLKFM